MKRSASRGLVALLIAGTLGACGQATTALSWTRLTLPGATGLVLRDVADCADHWYAVGAVTDPSGVTRPAAWTSTDARAWRSVPFRPLAGSYYGPHDVISSVACADGRVAMIGAMPGGAHGIPRVSTWRLDDGTMVENAAPFETYGGDSAVDLGPIEAGSGGFAMAGNRTSGAAAWLSTDGRTFTLHEGAAGLASDELHQATARDVAELPDGQWAFVGGTAVRGSLDGQAAMWLTRDGRTWTRSDPPAATGFNEIHRVIRDGDDLLAAGARDTTFQLWRWHAGKWTAGEQFGGAAEGVRSLTVAGGEPVLVGGGLWIGGVAQPTPAEPVAAAGRGDILLLATGGGLFTSDLPATGR